MSVVEAAHLLKVGVEALEEAFLVGQEGHAVVVGLSITNGDERVFKVEVLDT